MQTTITQEMIDANPILGTLGAVVGDTVSVYVPDVPGATWTYTVVGATA